MAQAHLRVHEMPLKLASSKAAPAGDTTCMRWGLPRVALCGVRSCVRPRRVLPWLGGELPFSSPSAARCAATAAEGCGGRDSATLLWDRDCAPRLPGVELGATAPPSALGAMFLLPLRREGALGAAALVAPPPPAAAARLRLRLREGRALPALPWGGGAVRGDAGRAVGCPPPLLCAGCFVLLLLLPPRLLARRASSSKRRV